MLINHRPELLPVKSRPAARLAPCLCLILALLTGCTSLGLVEPEVTLVDLEFTDLTLFETSGVFTVRLANENPEPLVIEGGVYNLYLGGWKIGKGLSDQQIEVPALGTATDSVELHMNNLAIAAQLRSIWDTGVFDYRIKAKIYVDRGYGRRTLTIENEGRFELDERRRSATAATASGPQGAL